MAEAPQPRPMRDVIPLHSERAAEPVGRRSPTALLSVLRELRVPPDVAALVRVNAREALQFFAPSLLLALGAALLALLAGRVATALGLPGVSAGTVATTAGGWTLLATGGGALAWRGVTLACTRWR